MSNVVEGPWVKARPPCLFHYVRLRTEEQLGWLERLLLANEIYARSLLDLNPVFDVRTMEYNTWHVEPDPVPAAEWNRDNRAKALIAPGRQGIHLLTLASSASRSIRTAWRYGATREIANAEHA